MAHFDYGELKSYEGVSGWLLFFCINITILLPGRVITYISETSEYLPKLENIPSIKAYIYLQFSLEFLVAIFGIWVGLALWKIKPRAVKLAKIFLISLIISSIIQTLALFMMDLPLGVSNALKSEAYKTTITQIGGSIFWYIYFNMSKRVQATYNDETINF